VSPENVNNPNLALSEPTEVVVKTEASAIEDKLEGVLPNRDLAEQAPQEDISHLESSFEMTPSSILIPQSTNWDPKTGRLRLWPKD